MIHPINVIMKYSVVRYQEQIGWITRRYGKTNLVVGKKMFELGGHEKVDLLMSPPELAQAWIESGGLRVLVSRD